MNHVATKVLKLIFSMLLNNMCTAYAAIDIVSMTAVLISEVGVTPVLLNLHSSDFVW